VLTGFCPGDVIGHFTQGERANFREFSSGLRRFLALLRIGRQQHKSVALLSCSDPSLTGRISRLGTFSPCRRTYDKYCNDENYFAFTSLRCKFTPLTLFSFIAIPCRLSQSSSGLQRPRTLSHREPSRFPSVYPFGRPPLLVWSFSFSPDPSGPGILRGLRLAGVAAQFHMRAASLFSARL
jgi:hypothetical protein